MRSERARRSGGAAGSAVPVGELPPFGFADFYRSHCASMVRFACLLTGSLDVAQDVVQDVFVRMHPRWARVRDPEAYLRRSVINACRTHHRRMARERAKHARAVALAASPTDGLDVSELVDALAALPYRQRAALVLRFYHDLSEAATAEVLGCRPGTVGSLVHRGLEQLKRVIVP